LNDDGSLNSCIPTIPDKKQNTMIPENKTVKIPVICFLLKKLIMKELMIAGKDKGTTISKI